MTLGVGLVIPGAIAPAGAPTIDVDAVDKAAAVLPGLVSYVRPKRVVNPGANFIDRMGLTVTALNGGAVKSPADAAFNGRPVFDYAATGNNPHEIAVAAPASFTFLAVLRFSAWKGTSNFYGDSAGFVSFFNGAGTVNLDADWNTAPNPEGGNLATPIALNETCVFWLSHDAATKTSRWGKNSAVASGSYLHAQAHAPNGTHRPHPFGFSSTSPGGNFGGKSGAWVLSNVAMGTGVGNADTPLANLIAAAKTYYGIA